MDGLTISDSDSLLRTGQTTSQIRNEKLNREAAVEAGGVAQPSFADTLKEAVNSTNALSQEANVQMQKLATGETKNIPEVMIAAEKASVAFKLLMQVRNKVIDAYQEVMKMQV